MQKEKAGAHLSPNGPLQGGNFPRREMALDLAAERPAGHCLLHPLSAPDPAPSRVPLACLKNPTRKHGETTAAKHTPHTPHSLLSDAFIPDLEFWSFPKFSVIPQTCFTHLETVMMVYELNVPFIYTATKCAGGVRGDVKDAPKVDKDYA